MEYEVAATSPKLLIPSSTMAEDWRTVYRFKDETPLTSASVRNYVEALKRIAYCRPATMGDIMTKMMTITALHRPSKSNSPAAIVMGMLAADVATVIPSMLSLPLPQSARNTALSGALMRHVKRLGREWVEDILSRRGVSLLEELPPAAIEEELRRLEMIP